MKRWKQRKVSLSFVILLLIFSIAITLDISRLFQQQSLSQTHMMTSEELYQLAVKDAMTIEKEEILPLVSLEKGSPYAIQDEKGRVFLLTLHKYPESYPNGTEVDIQWGEVWTFTGGELADWYKENKDKVQDWPLRLRQLIGLSPDNKSTYFTAMWVYPKDVKRPANQQGIEKSTMTEHVDEKMDAEFKEWFDGNIIKSYFDGAYPWTRLGYTYDWADNGKEYGLSEFLVANKSTVKVAYTVTIENLLKMLEDGTWLPDDVHTY